MKRRHFLRAFITGGIGMAASPIIQAAPAPLTDPKVKPATNIDVAKAIPRTANSLPGKYPGKVVKVQHPNPITDGKADFDAAYEMVKQSLLELTGEKELPKAWLQFVTPQDVIGIKVNPIAGKLLSTSHAVTHAIIKQLEEAGIPRDKLVIWDRRQESLDDAGYTPENYPGIRISSTEWYDENKSYYNAEGRLYGEDLIDKEQFFFADVDGEYDDYTLPFMVNGGKNSYFSKLCTQELTKIINVPVMKNSRNSITLCLKNLGFGSITNTQRLHTSLWHETCAYICAFPPIRDKVVLNIADGIIGCFDGGPAANPQFICQYKTILAGTDPVAVDRIGYDIIIAKRFEEGVQKSENAEARKYMEIAQELGLGIADKDKIDLKEITV